MVKLHHAEPRPFSSPAIFSLLEAFPLNSPSPTPTPPLNLNLQWETLVPLPQARVSPSDPMSLPGVSMSSCAGCAQNTAHIHSCHRCIFYYNLFSMDGSCVSRARGVLLSLVFHPVLLSYNWHVVLYTFKVYSIIVWLWSDYSNLVNIHHFIELQKYFSLVIKTFRIYSLSNFDIDNTVLLTTATMLLHYMPRAYVCYTGSLYLLTPFIHFLKSPSLVSGNCQTLVCFHVLIFFLDSTCEWDCIVFVFSDLFHLA